MEHDLPPDQNVYQDVYGNPSSDTYERLRKWVRHQMKETFLIPLTRKEIVDIKFAGLSAAEKNSIKYAEKRMPPADLLDRIEENILETCAGWLVARRNLVQDMAHTGVTRSLCGVPIDERILLEALVLLTQSRDTGLLFFKDDERSMLNGVKEEEMPAYWQWKSACGKWGLNMKELPLELLSKKLCEYLKKCYSGLYENSSSAHEVVAEWFRSVWRSLRGDSSEVAKRCRERTRDIKRVVSLTEASASQTARDVNQLQDEFLALKSEVQSLKDQCSILQARVQSLEANNTVRRQEASNSRSSEALNRPPLIYDGQKLSRPTKSLYDQAGSRSIRK